MSYSHTGPKHLVSGSHARPKRFRSGGHAGPKRLGFGSRARPMDHGSSRCRTYDAWVQWLSDPSKQQTKRGQLCTLVVRREKMQTIDHQWQSNHNISTHTIPCEKEHNCTSSDTVDGQIWHPGSVSRASLIAWVSSICWGIWNTLQQLFN
jgi:hypothetical protein